MEELAKIENGLCYVDDPYSRTHVYDNFFGAFKHAKYLQEGRRDMNHGQGPNWPVRLVNAIGQIVNMF